MPAHGPRWIREQPARALAERTNSSASSSSAAAPPQKRAPAKLAFSDSPAPSAARALARRGAAPPASSPHGSTPRLRQATLPFLRTAGPSAAPGGGSGSTMRSSPAPASRPAKRPASSPLSSENEAAATTDAPVQRRRLRKQSVLADAVPAIAAAFGPAPPSSLRKQPLPQDENSEPSSPESSPPRRAAMHQSRSAVASSSHQPRPRRPLQSRALAGPSTPQHANTSPLKGTTPYMHDTLSESQRLGWEEHMPSTLAQWRDAAGINQSREDQAAARERERLRNRERAEQERRAALQRLQGTRSNGSARKKTARRAVSPAAPHASDACGGAEQAEGSGSASTSALPAPRQPRILAYETQPGATQLATASSARRKPLVAASRTPVSVFRDSLELGPTQPDLGGRASPPRDWFGGSSPLTSERSDTNYEALAVEAAAAAPPPHVVQDFDEQSQTAPGGTFSVFQRGSSTGPLDPTGAALPPPRSTSHRSASQMARDELSAELFASSSPRQESARKADSTTRAARHSSPRRKSALTQNDASRAGAAWAQLDQTWLGVDAGQAGPSNARASTSNPLEQAQLGHFGFRHTSAPSAQREHRRAHEPSELLMRGSRAYLSDDEGDEEDPQRARLDADGEATLPLAGAASDDETQPLDGKASDEETQPLPHAADGEETQPLPHAGDGDEETQPLPHEGDDDETQPLSVASSQTESSSGEDDVVPHGALAAMEREMARQRAPAEAYALVPDMESMDTQTKAFFSSL
ncbi:hypothetical protein FA09DRAFT_329081 [Tilletiopsis washingtonensis]|uniref:Uncharacterized protein n=1 Tax=Tilletiopsis washingtonensis TaxID=58919 RepID=A0A316ZDK8_9BASI|nr:hypothetical protein FA09DRAFT_329081 [Tilletiopsis washingtonensis]PWN99138.1 hypothetical protein FA09DRAFT_329081 [Tilletiopsis washingtonensis]